MRTAGLISKAEQVSVQPVPVAERSILPECLHACVAVSGRGVTDESHVAPLAFGRKALERLVANSKTTNFPTCGNKNRPL